MLPIRIIGPVSILAFLTCGAPYEARAARVDVDRLGAAEVRVDLID